MCIRDSSSTNGTMYGITNDEAREAEKLFVGEEGIDLDPAASVAVASLIKAVEDGSVKKEDSILLHITGGGYKRLQEDCRRHAIGAQCETKPSDQGALDEVEKELKEFVKAL